MEERRESLLGHVLGGLPGAQDAPGDGDHAGLVGGDQGVEVDGWGLGGVGGHGADHLREGCSLGQTTFGERGWKDMFNPDNTEGKFVVDCTNIGFKGPVLMVWNVTLLCCRVLLRCFVAVYWMGIAVPHMAWGVSHFYNISATTSLLGLTFLLAAPVMVMMFVDAGLDIRRVICLTRGRTL